MLENLSTLTFIFLFIAIFAAGFVDSIAGGGGLIQNPALLIAFPQTETIQVVGTSKTAAFFGTTAAALRYRMNAANNGKLIASIAGPAFIASGIGSYLASSITTQQLKLAVVVALFAIFFYTLSKPELGKVEKMRHTKRRRFQIAIFWGSVIGFYDGLIGPGTGAFLMLLFVGVLGFEFINASFMAKVVNASTNLASIIVIGIGSSIMWKLALILAVANVAGGLIGSSVAISKGSSFIRKFYLGVTFIMILRVTYDLISQWS